MSKTNIPNKTVSLLWAQAAGRCQYEGCNEILYRDMVTQRRGNSSYIAHIVGDSPDGPRGDAERSGPLSKDISNLMLLCDTHHRLIDQEDVEGHPEKRLVAMKKKHEERIERVTGITPDKSSMIVLYGANIGEQEAHLSYNLSANAILPEYYPAENSAFEVAIKNVPFRDRDDIYWNTYSKDLEEKIKHSFWPRFKAADTEHCSIFGFAPQPLLVQLGTLVNDIHKVKVYQKTREPDTWDWLKEDTSNFSGFSINRPTDTTKTPRLVFALSADTITERITEKHIADSSIWEVTVDNPDNDMLRTEEQLTLFRQTVRKVLDEINTASSSDQLHVYMAMPVACAIELGRCWMPKAHKAMVLYDFNTANGEDKEAITIKNE